MFRGNCPSRIDEKGRLRLPAEFKHEIDRNYDDNFYITYIPGNGIEIYPMRVWEKIEEQILAIQDSQPVLTRKFLDLTSYYKL